MAVQLVASADAMTFEVCGVSEVRLASGFGANSIGRWRDVLHERSGGFAGAFSLRFAKWLQSLRARAVRVPTSMRRLGRNWSQRDGTHRELGCCRTGF
jgi:hypothetical protein